MLNKLLIGVGVVSLVLLGSWWVGKPVKVITPEKSATRVQTEVQVTAPSKTGSSLTTIKTSAVSGFVTLVKPGGFLVKRDTGTDVYDVKTTTSTLYQKDGVMGSSSDVKIGAAVIVTGAVDAGKKTAEAQAVLIVSVK